MHKHLWVPRAAGRSGSTLASDLPLTMSAHDFLGVDPEMALVTDIATSVDIEAVFFLAVL